MSIADYSDAICQAIFLNSISNLLDTLTEISERVLSAETILNYQGTPKKETSLHLAASLLKGEFIRLLLLNGADANVQDVNGRTPTLNVTYSLQKDCRCEKCCRQAVQCIHLLGQFGGDMNIPDAGGEVPLHLSATLGVKGVALEILNQGANLHQIRESRKVLLTILLENIPDIMLPIFDGAITIVPEERQITDTHLEFDMGVLILHDPKRFINNAGIQGMGDSDDNSDLARPEMGFLNYIQKHRSRGDFSTYRAILQHPLVQVFTDVKWKRLRLMYYGYLGFHINLLLWYVIFLFMVVFVDCPVPEATEARQVNGSTSTFSAIKGALFTPTSKCEIQLHTRVLAVWILFCASICACKEIFQLTTDFWSYVMDIFNLAQMIGLGLIGATTIITLDPVSLFHFWLFPLASTGVAICWFQLFLHLGQLPSLALYVDMFSKVLFNFTISLGMYSSIILGFVLSYSMLFPSNIKTEDLPINILRILTMMLGELDFDAMFAPDKSIRSPLLAYLWYAIFLVVISMVLMNLLVGLAVNDIGSCRKHSESVVMQRRIRYLAYLEKSWFMATVPFPARLKNCLRRYASITHNEYRHTRVIHCKRRHVDAKYSKYIVMLYPNDPRDSRFYAQTKAAIRRWLSQQENTGNREAPCCRKNSTFLTQPQRFQPVRPFTEDNEIKISRVPSAKSAGKHESDMKILSRLEITLNRLENRFLDLTSKVDEIVEVVSKPQVEDD